MKKLIFLTLTMTSLLILDSCRKQDLQKESPPPVPEPLSATEAQRAETAGDGLYDVLGWGYDATAEYANANSVGFQIIDLAAFKASNPDRLVEEYPRTQEYKEDYGAEARSYSLMISSQVDATASLKIPLFKGILNTGFSSSMASNYKYDAKYVYGSYNLIIKQKRVRINSDAITLQNYLTPTFVSDVNAYYNDPRILVQKYGTHVLLDIYTGAKMDLLFQSETKNQNREEAARIGIKAGVKDVFNLDISNSISTSNSSMNYSRKLYYRTRGGDPAQGLVGTLNLDVTNPTINMANWQNSSTTANSVFVDIGQYGMIYIYDLIADPVKRASVKAYVDQYLIDNSVYLDYLAIPVYRYYNPPIHDHYYNIVQDASYPWSYEGIEFYAYSYQAPNTVPVYSFWNGTDHFYSVSPALPAQGNYTAEGVRFYAYPYQSTGTVPIYRYWSSRDSDHFYTRTNGTYTNYIAEGIEFYAY